MQLVIICNRSNRKRPFRSEVPSILAIDEIRRSWVQEPSAKAKFPVMLSGWPIALDGWVCGRRADQLDIIVMIEVGVYCRQIGAAIMSKAGDDTDLNGEQGCPFFPLEQHLNAQSHAGCVRGEGAGRIGLQYAPERGRDILGFALGLPSLPLTSLQSRFRESRLVFRASQPKPIKPVTTHTTFQCATPARFHNASLDSGPL